MKATAKTTGKPKGGTNHTKETKAPKAAPFQKMRGIWKGMVFESDDCWDLKPFVQ